MRLKLRNHCENADDYRPLFRLHSLKHRSELGAWVQACPHRLAAWVHELQLRACWLSAKLLVVPRETGEGEVVHPVTVSTRSSRLQRQVCETTASPRPQRFQPCLRAAGGKKLWAQQRFHPTDEGLLEVWVTAADVRLGGGRGRFVPF